MLNRKLTVLKNIVESGGFTNAAKKMYTSQPAVSRDIKLLEKEFGIVIFESTKTNLTLTAEGEVLYRYAVEIEAMNEHLMNDIYEVTESVKGEIRIGVSHTYGVYVLPGVLLEASQKYPDLNCHIHVGNSQDIVDRVKDKSIDVGVIEIDKNYAGVELHTLFHDEMFLMAHNDINLDEVNQCFVREQYSGTRYYQEKVLKMIEPSPVKVEINHTELIKFCVRNKMGFTILSKRAVEDEDKTIIQLNPTGVTRHFSIVTSKSRYITPKTEAFIEIIKEKR